MSVLLFIVGAIAVLAGAALVAVGIPINEFSFGNTLIAAGATSFIGGLIILGLGAVVAQLQRVVEALATRPPLRTSWPLEPPAVRPSTSRIPFPSKPKAAMRDQRPGALPLDVADNSPSDDHAADTFAPTLHNPDEAPVAVAESEELPLSPRAPSTGLGTGRRPLDTDWRASPAPMPPVTEQPAAFFDTMWPATSQRPTRPLVPGDAKAGSASAAKNQPKEDSKPEPKYEPKVESRFAPKLEPRLESKAEPKLDPKYDVKSEPQFDAKLEANPETTAPEPEPVRVEPDAFRSPPGELRAVAILKSGMVDGMSYTLYVDGSIEAELPQGTLRFASINELRSHLEKTS